MTAQNSQFHFAPPQETDGAAMRRRRERMDALTQLNLKTEPLFLAAGGELVALATQFDSVELPMLALAEFVQSDTLPWLSQRLSDIDGLIIELSSILSGGVTQFFAVSDAAHRLRLELLEMERTVRTMSIVALNARVNVAALSERNSSLDAFSKNASLLVSKAADIMADIREAVGLMVDKSAHGRDLAQSAQRHITHNLSKVIKELGHDVGRLKVSTEAAGKAGRDLSVDAKTIRKQISTVVFALQVGDSTRQRLEHVIGTYGEVEKHVDPILRASLCDLALRLLVSCNADHAASMDGIGHQIRDVRDRSLKMLELGGGFAVDTAKGSKESTVHLRIKSLRSELASSRTIQSELVDHARTLLDGLAALASVVNGMGAVEGQMRTIGLNAVIACASLGSEGPALKEISAQLRELATAMTLRFVNLNAHLSHMSLATSKVCEQLSVETQSPFELLDQRIDEMFASLERIENSVGMAALGAGQLKASMQQDRQLGSVQRLIDHASALMRLAASSNAGDQAATVGPIIDHATFDDVFSELRARYTSAKEREIHDMVQILWQGGEPLQV